MSVESGFSEEATCLADRRSISVTDEAQPVLAIEMDRLLGSPNGQSAPVPSIKVRNDAEAVTVSWVRLAHNSHDGALALDVEPGAVVAERGTSLSNKESHEFDFPDVSGNDTILVRVRYKVTESLATGLWWASYVAPLDRHGAHSRAEFRVRAPKDLVSQIQGAWQFTSRPLGGDESEFEWVFPGNGRPASEDSCQQDTPFVLVGKRTNWQTIGQGLIEQATEGSCETTEGGPAKRLLQKSEVNWVLAVFEDLCTFQREIPASGWRPKPSSDVASRRAGDCKDLSVLLAELLDRRGVACSLVYRATTVPSLDGIIPCPYLFDHVFVAVSTESGTWMLDPFAGREWHETQWQCGDTVETHGNLLIVPWRSATLANNSKLKMENLP